jgi:hypothetical protein
VRISESGGGAGQSKDHQYYDIVVGNAPAGDTLAVCDFLDTGNGMAWKAALALAATFPLPTVKSVFTRRGLYDLGAAGSDGLPITVPLGVLNQCDGQGSTTILSTTDPATQGSLLSLVVQGWIRDVGIFVQNVATVNNGNDLSFVLITDSGDARDYQLGFDGQGAGFAAKWGATFIGVLQLATAGNASRSERGRIFGKPSRLIDGSGVGSVPFRVQGDSTDQTTRNIDTFIKSTETGGTPRVPDIGFEIFNAKHVRVSRPTVPGARTKGILVRANAFTNTDIQVEGHRILWTVTAPVQRLGIQLLSENAGVVDGVKIGTGFLDCFGDNGKGCIGIDVHSTGAGSSTQNCEIDGSDPHNFAEAAHVESVAAGLVDANGVVNTRVSDNTAGINNVNDVNFRAAGDW